jgi:hypothetical protein
MISENRENRRRSSLTTESSPRKDVDMTQNELAERLRDMSDALNICGADYSDVLLDAARELDRRSWIPVTERLPPDRTVVLAWSGKRVAFGYISDGNWIDTLYGWVIPNGPTHWMPLPAPPTDGK